MDAWAGDGDGEAAFRDELESYRRAVATASERLVAEEEREHRPGGPAPDEPSSP